MITKTFTDKEKSVLAFKAAQIANQSEAFGGNYYNDDADNIKNTLEILPLFISADRSLEDEQKRIIDSHIDLHIYFLKIAYMLGIQDEYLEKIKTGLKLSEIKMQDNEYADYSYANVTYCNNFIADYMVQRVKAKLLFGFLYAVILEHKDEILKSVNEEFSELLDNTVYEVGLSNLDDLYFESGYGLPLFVLKRKRDIGVNSDEYKKLVDRSFLLYNSFCRTGASEEDGYHFIMINLYSEHSKCPIAAVNLTILRPEVYSYY